MEAYTYLAQVYNELMFDVNYSEWASYLDTFLKQRRVSTILEVACGTGNMTGELYRLGYNIVGSDISPDMLRIANELARREGRDLTFVLQDMRCIEVGNKVDAVVCVCDGPNYIDLEGIGKFASSSYNALNKNGVLLFDISTRYKLEEVMDGQVFFDDGDDAACIWQNTYDQNNNTLLMDVTLFIRRGELFERLVEQHTQYAHDIDEVKEMVQRAGYQSVKAVECFINSTPQTCTQRVQFICSK